MACGGSQDHEPITLSKGLVEYEFHKNNIGEIVFMDKWISFKNFTPLDNQQSIALTEGGEFYIHILPQYSQTYYLSQLAPHLSPNELCKNGHWNVQFYVDDKLVYQDNVNPGGGACFYRNEYAAVGIPFVSNDDGDTNHWGAFLWKRFFYKEKNEKLFQNGTHKLTLEFRPYLKVDGKIKYGEVVAKGSVNLSMKEIPVNEEDIRVQSIAPTEEWQIADQNYDKTFIREINKKIGQNRYKNITSIVVLRNGKLLVEEYFNGANRGTLHNPRSVGKSFVGTFMGMAIADGYIKSEEEPLSQFYQFKKFKNDHPAKAETSIKDLLMMNSAFLGDDSDMSSPGNEENMYPTKDWVAFALDLPIDTTKLKQRRWEYFTAGSVVLGDILNKSVPGNLENYAEKKFFTPLNIQSYQWQYTPKGVVSTAGGLQLRSLDFAKYGLLYQQGGTWNGMQIIPKEWVDKSTMPLIQRGEAPNEGYGYQLWHDVIEFEEKHYPVSYATGNGGNKIMIFKDIPLVIVITATAYGDPIGHIQASEMVEEYLLPMVVKSL